MLKLQKKRYFIRKTKLGFENEGVLNPVIIVESDFTYLFYRAISKVNYSNSGHFVGSRRYIS